MVHEKDPDAGGAPFHTLFQQTPEDLVRQKRLYDDLAIDLHAAPAHRTVSLRLVMRALGAKPARRRRLAPLRWGWLAARWWLGWRGAQEASLSEASTSGSRSGKKAKLDCGRNTPAERV